MEYKEIGQSKRRWDAYAKVTGKAEYTGDILVKNALYAKICRAEITHGHVKKIDISEALKVDGVVKIMTPEDLPDYKFPTAGHPFSIADHNDVCDRNLLTKRVRLYGDEIAAVIAETEFAAEKAVHLIKVEYEELPFYLTPEESLANGSLEIHEGSGNTIASTLYESGNLNEKFSQSDTIIEGHYKTSIVQHCAMENQEAYAYQDVDGKWVCVSSTQIPHICKRILGQAFQRPWGDFRVIKPFIGGGFGVKQDITIEPLVVALSMAVGGRPVRMRLTREESLAYTRVRHAISYYMKMGLSKEGTILALDVKAYSNNGAYASHGHAIAAKGAMVMCGMYNIKAMRYESSTVYTNTAAAGAMRGYGAPQAAYALECHMEKAATEMGFDPVKMRLDNLLPQGIDHPTTGLPMNTYAIRECFEEGMKRFQWDEKRQLAQKSKGREKPRGVGLASFSYATGVYPILMEIGGCRLTLMQDGTVKMMVGATEIGQGSDTALSQIAAETLGISFEKIYCDAVTDTDYSPYDSGSYASRQSYVSGTAVKKCAEKLKRKILETAAVFCKIAIEKIDLAKDAVIQKKDGNTLISVADVALKNYYHRDDGYAVSAEVSNKIKENSYSTGVTFAEVEVDKKLGTVTILSILNVHDSGKILNPLLASGQVEGGMGMGIAYGLEEVLTYDKKSGRPVNNNLLDYKMPTIMDTPPLDTLFVEPYEPTGPYGNKSLGEPPICSPAPAIRNAVYDAIGVPVDTLPITAQSVLKAIKGGE